MGGHGSVGKKKGWTTEAEIGVMCSEMEKGARHGGMQVASRSLKMDPLEPSEGTQLCSYLALAQ